MSAQNSNVNISAIYSSVILLSFNTNHPLIPAKLIHILAKHEVRSYHVFLLYTFSCRESYVLYKARTSENVHRKHFLSGANCRISYSSI